MAHKKSRYPKAKKGAWFIRVRGSYLPASASGWLTYIPYAGYLIFTLVVGWKNVSSHGLAILFIVPNWIAATAVMTWIAARKS
jgi:hypothetical protein